VDQGQLEAAAALGIPKRREFFKIVLPQAMRGILPNAANEVISLFKGTSIVSVRAIAELFYQVQVIYGRNGRVVPLLMVATVWYIILASVLSVVQFYVERHYAKGAVRTIPLTPMTYSERSRFAFAICGASSLSKTTCVTPSRSRTSTNSSPPRSRTRWTHPSSTTLAPTSDGRSAPHV